MKINQTPIEGMYQIKVDQKNRLATRNKVPGVSVYGERLIRSGKDEYRLWDPYRSKYASASLYLVFIIEVIPFSYCLLARLGRHIKKAKAVRF